MTATLFDLTFYLAVPFWLLMIVAPRWQVTERIVASPWIATPPLVVYLILALPHFGQLWRAVSRPDLVVLQQFLGSGPGAVTIWAHLIAFDLFLGRWMYWQARERDIHPLVMAPVLMLTILLSPIGLLVFLGIRQVTHQQEAAAFGGPVSSRSRGGSLEHRRTKEIAQGPGEVPRAASAILRLVRRQPVRR